MNNPDNGLPTDWADTYTKIKVACNVSNERSKGGKEENHQRVISIDTKTIALHLHHHQEFN
jgi:hypothetical protein